MGFSPYQNTVLQCMDSSHRQVKSSDPQAPDPKTSGTHPIEPLDHLRQLVQDACQHPSGSLQRQKKLTQLIRELTPRLWHTSDTYYADALQQTWIYFCRNLCEATTGRAYDPNQANPVTWLNAYLKRRLQDFRIAENAQRMTTISQSSLMRNRPGNDQDGLLDPIDRLPAPPDIPPWLDQVRNWATADADGSLNATCLSHHPDVTAQRLILKRLPPETPWKALSVEYGISIGTLSSFYQRQCLTKLRAFGQTQGYL